ncbi:hypothetical protein [Halorubrum sp. JWXQ-INN 858]|uniref:hypothetical protein n=1 Tax=Halorubrum sp. JWXQ-INN 858 TaxID=2690782 RepID=UPI00135727A1|nr:hypothetical protein [Halorubrum sp. JWXQ-INN 858]
MHDEGELLIFESAFNGRDVEIGLYNDSTDSLAEASTYSDITSEPDGSDYSPQTVTDPDVSANGGDTEVTLGEISFDVGNAASTVDYVYVRDASSGDLVFTNELPQEYDLDSVDIIDLTNVGLQYE